MSIMTSKSSKQADQGSSGKNKRKADEDPVVDDEVDMPSQGFTRDTNTHPSKSTKPNNSEANKSNLVSASEIQKVKTENKKIKVENTRFKSEITQLKQEVTRQEEQIKSMRSGIVDLNKQLDDAEHEVACGRSALAKVKKAWTLEVGRMRDEINYWRERTYKYSPSTTILPNGHINKQQVAKYSVPRTFHYSEEPNNQPLNRQISRYPADIVYSNQPLGASHNRMYVEAHIQSIKREQQQIQPSTLQLSNFSYGSPRHYGSVNSTTHYDPYHDSSSQHIHAGGVLSAHPLNHLLQYISPVGRVIGSSNNDFASIERRNLNYSSRATSQVPNHTPAVSPALDHATIHDQRQTLPSLRTMLDGGPAEAVPNILRHHGQPEVDNKTRDLDSPRDVASTHNSNPEDLVEEH